MAAINIELPNDKVLRLCHLPSGDVEIEIDGVINYTGKDSDWSAILPANRCDLVARFLCPPNSSPSNPS